MFETLKSRMEYAMAGPPKVTQADLAKACGVSRPSVNAWCSGETKTLKGKSLVHAAAFLKVRPRWLGEGVGPIRTDDLFSPDNRRVSEPEQEVSATRARAHAMIDALAEDDIPEVIHYMQWINEKKNSRFGDPPAEANGR
jgi:transcriptional regulator with XRE-family HTH domain